MEAATSIRDSGPGARGAIEDPGDGSTSLAFSTFYRETRDRVFRTVLLATRSPERAEDAVQEAYTRALTAWDDVSAHRNPTAWVARVALNQAISWWRIRRRELSAPPERAAAPDERPIDEAIVRLVWALPRRQRQVVALRILLDQSTEETARILGLQQGTVKAHLHRALGTLRLALTDAGYKELTDA